MKKWYQKRTWQLGIAGAVVATVIGGYFIKQAMPTTFDSASGVDLDSPTSTRR